MILLKHSRDMTNLISPFTVELCSFSTCDYHIYSIYSAIALNSVIIIATACQLDCFFCLP